MGKKLILLFAILLTGCSASRYKKTDINSIKNVEQNLTHTNVLYNHDYTKILDSLIVVKNFTFDIYDTEHPDSTGNYPVKMHGEMTHRATNISSFDNNIETVETTQDTLTYKSNEQYTEHVKKKTKINDWYILAFGLLGFLVFLIVWYKVCKKQNLL